MSLVSMNGTAIKTEGFAQRTATHASITLREIYGDDFGAGMRGDTPLDTSPAGLREQCCNDARVSEVDYDLAFDSLKDAGLIKTVPMKLFEGPPPSGSIVFIPGFISANKYMYLTESGYQEEAGSVRESV